MPDPARVAQAMAVEIPVTIQGSQNGEETGRELFTENTKTILTFDSGALLNLHARVALGQSLLLRNEQSGRETLCRVVEGPAEGQEGYTELEFIAPNPGFWGVFEENAEPRPQEGSRDQEQSAAHGMVQMADEDPLAMIRQGAGASSEFTIKAPFREELVPAHEVAPTSASASTPPVTESRGPAGERIDAALKNTPAVPASLPPDVEESIDAKDAQNLAMLIARDGKRALRSVPDTPKVARSVERGASALTASVPVEGEPRTQSQVVVPKPSVSEWMGSALDKLTTGQGAIATQVALSVVILVAMAFIWNAVRPLFSSGNERAEPTASPSEDKPRILPQPAPPILSSAFESKAVMAGPAAKGRNSASGTAPPAVASALRPRGQASANRIPQSPPRTPPMLGQANQTHPGDLHASGTFPAKVVWEVQPAFPSWAKELEVDRVVKLDALIDENGNVAQTKVLSGPRALQHSAQQAVMLWIFEPAQVNGKPTGSHLVLTVEFQR